MNIEVRNAGKAQCLVGDKSIKAKFLCSAGPCVDVSRCWALGQLVQVVAG